jgi:hypothetical protein
MGKVYEALEGRLLDFVNSQPVFFVATAPDGPGGHINLSPKGGRGTLLVLGPRTVAYLDYTGSGVETTAHLRQNGRITVMWCAFAGPPKIVRVHGRGEPVFPDDPRFADLVAQFEVDPMLGLRSVIVIEAERISDSCGYGVPFMDYVGERSTMRQWADNKGPEKIAKYQLEKNSTSLDGLPGLPVS